MYFETFEALLNMDGHGVFVWSAYLITVVVVAAILVAPGRRQKNILRQLTGDLRRAQVATGNTEEEA